MVYIKRTTWSATDLAALAEGYHYELVKGRLVRMAPTTADQAPDRSTTICPASSRSRLSAKIEEMPVSPMVMP